MGLKAILEDERISLRAVEPEDIHYLYEWENDTENWLISSTQSPFSIEVLKRYIEHSSEDIYTAKQLRLMITAKDLNNETIGIIDLFDFDPQHQRAGVGILIAPEFRNKTYARCALTCLMSYCKRILHIHQLYASMLCDNKASVRLFHSCGFEQTGIRKHWIRFEQEWHDELFMQRIL